jgi:hypothetical protein
MTPDKPPPGTIPTLTEVVPWPEAPPAAPAPAAAPSWPAPSSQALSPSPASPTVLPARAEPAGVAGPVPAPAAAVASPALDEAQLAQRVLVDLQKQVDLMLEVRLREALAPILTRAGDAIVRDARKELTAALHDVVARAVAKELGRGDKP